MLLQDIIYCNFDKESITAFRIPLPSCILHVDWSSMQISTGKNTFNNDFWKKLTIEDAIFSLNCLTVIYKIKVYQLYNGHMHNEIIS